MLKAWLYFSVGSQHYGNSAATRMLAIMIKHKMSPYSSENYKGDFLERLVLQKSTLAALSGDVPAKMFLANLYGNTEKTCFKGVDILKNVSRQLIEEEYLSRIFVKHGVYLQEQHFFRKRFAQVQPSSEEVQMIELASTVSGKHMNNLEELAARYFIGGRGIRANRSRAYELAERMVSEYKKDSRMAHRLLAYRYFWGFDVAQNITQAMLHFEASKSAQPDVKCFIGIVHYLGLGEYKADREKGLALLLSESDCAVYLLALIQNRNEDLNISLNTLLVNMSADSSPYLADYGILSLYADGQLYIDSCKRLFDQFKRMLDSIDISGNMYHSMLMALRGGAVLPAFLKNLDLLYWGDDEALINTLYYLDVEQVAPQLNYDSGLLTAQDHALLGELCGRPVKGRLLDSLLDPSLAGPVLRVFNRSSSRLSVIGDCLMRKVNYCFYLHYKEVEQDPAVSQLLMKELANLDSDDNYVLETRYQLHLRYRKDNKLSLALKLLQDALGKYAFLGRLLLAFEDPGSLLQLASLKKGAAIFGAAGVLLAVAQWRRKCNLARAEEWEDEDEEVEAEVQPQEEAEVQAQEEEAEEVEAEAE